jgi:hypothetical protein
MKRTVLDSGQFECLGAASIPSFTFLLHGSELDFEPDSLPAFEVQKRHCSRCCSNPRNSGSLLLRSCCSSFDHVLKVCALMLLNSEN